MTKPRIPETDHGITGAVTVANFDEMQRHLRDKGWIQTQSILKSGIQKGHALEVGHGPGYLGLEWLKNTQGTRLTGLDISPDMTFLVAKIVRSYGFEKRTHYECGQGNHLPFADQVFDAVFTNGSLHEWMDPTGTFNEIFRVLKHGGRYFISDLRRDLPAWVRWFLSRSTKPVSIRPYLFSSINAAYTPSELKAMLAKTNLRGAKVTADMINVMIVGQVD